MDVVSSLEMKVLPKSVDNGVGTLKSDVIATLWQLNTNLMTMLQSCDFIKNLIRSI